MVIQDPNGQYPTFLRLLHVFVAKAVNALQGQSESLWVAEQASVTWLPEMEGVMDEIANCAVDPVEAGLARRPEEWPGVSHWLPCKRKVARPECYFGTRFRREFELEFQQPARSEDSVEQRRTQVRGKVRARTHEARSRVEATRRSFLGRKRVLRASFLGKARPHEVR